MKIVVCPDKFKGTLSAVEASEIISRAILFLKSTVEVVLLPMADGGDGTMEVLRDYHSTVERCSSVDALMRNIDTHYIIYSDSVAIIEMCKTVGLDLVESEFRNPEISSSYGFGIVIRNAIERGYRELVLAIGGSATNDCGIGMLSALGAKFYDSSGEELEPIGASLANIESFDTSAVEELIRGCKIEVACDVTNPLYGANGATMVYALQKGADNDMVDRLESGVIHFADVVKKRRGVDMNRGVSAGAAGGVGAALECFTSATLLSGARLVANIIGLVGQIESADLVITAEGKIDNQTQNGKVIDVVKDIANSCGVEVIAYCGVSDGSYDGELDIYPIVDGRITTSESLARAGELLYELVLKSVKKYII